MTDLIPGRCRVCRREFLPEQEHLVEHVHHALQDPFFAAIVDGPCSVCGATHPLYGPNGKPLCDDCDPRATYASPAELAACEVCGLPLLHQDAAVDGCHATCIPGDD